MRKPDIMNCDDSIFDDFGLEPEESEVMCCDGAGPNHGPVDLFEDDDGPVGTTATQDHPYCPRDVMAMLRDAGWLLYRLAKGNRVTPDEAGRAAWSVVRLLETYGAELEEEWYLDVDDWRH